MLDVKVKTNLTATVAPTVNDDLNRGYSVFSAWVDLAADRVYFAADVTAGAARWREVAAGVSVGGADNQLLTDDGDGGLVSESGLIFDGTNLGIGITPANIFQIQAAAGVQARVFIQGQGNNNEIQVIGYNNTASNGTDLELFKARGTLATPLASIDGDNLSVVKSLGHDGTSFFEAGEMLIDVDGTVSSGVVPGRIIFRTSDASGTRTERLRINSSGGIAVNNSTPNGLFDVRGDVGAAGVLELSTAETTVVDGDELGRINFRAPDDTAGGDAVLVAAAIYAEADATFSASVNNTELVFATGESETATEKMRLTSAGWLGLGTPAPDAPFHIQSTSDFIVKFESTDNRCQFSVRDNDTNTFIGAEGGAQFFGFGSTLATSDFVIKSSGNVGAGVVAPLEVFQADDAIAISSDAEGSVARLTRRTTHETHALTLGATSDTTTISIPSGARLLAVSFNVDATVIDSAGNDTWSADFITGSTTALAAGISPVINTKHDLMLPDEISTGVCQIRFTANGGDFSAGVIEIVAYYEELASLADV